MYLCKYCGREFEKQQSLSAHMGHCEQNPNRKIKTHEELSNISKKSAKTVKLNNPYKYEIKSFELTCQRCGKKYILNTTQEKIDRGKYSKYCSRSCANKRKHNDITKLKISKGVNNYYNDPTIKKSRQSLYHKLYTCKNCGKNFYFSDTNTKNRKYCSEECKNEWLKNNLYSKAGGYREGAGRSKHGWYRNIYCDSVYELVFLIYNLDHNIPISRCKRIYKYVYNGKEYTYHPDFEMTDRIIEIKGYYTDLVDIKTKSVNDIKIDILYKDDIKYCFDYVIYKYKKPKNRLYELYDTYKPKYIYKCGNCGKEFYRSYKLTTKNGFCSRSCACKYRYILGHKAHMNNINTKGITAMITE